MLRNCTYYFRESAGFESSKIMSLLSQGEAHGIIY